jgi:NAD(P)-dependent dehydrogenase (short-subunit alcohol dehydrogenase family)
LNQKAKACVVTGAASGLGIAFAKEALARGMPTVIVDINEPALRDVERSLSSIGPDIVTMTCDVSDAQDVDRLADRIAEKVGTPSLLFNNAGVSSRNGLIWESDPTDWDWVFGVNVFGVVNGIRSFVPRMLEAAKSDPDFAGRIVNTASMGGLFNPTLYGVYCASKHAVVSISEILHHDLDIVSPQVRCSVVCPYYVPTNINNAEDKRPTQYRKEQPNTRSQTIGQEFSDIGMASAKMTSQQVAALVFDEIAEDRFYILPHKKMLQSVRMRMEDIIELKSPRDPFSFRPEIGEKLRSELRIGR